jgi:hypothetical protein
MKNTLIIVLVIIIIGLGAWALLQSRTDTEQTQQPPSNTSQMQDDQNNDQQADQRGDTTIIGASAEGRDITAYHYGNGDTELLFVGGIHGGYEWNTVLVARELMEYLKDAPNTIPDNVTVTVVPTLNPDGLYKTVGTTGEFTQADVPSSSETKIAGRFNANGVDLNRNFDCDWQSEGVWQNTTVDAGSEVFSEPESQAIRTYIQSNHPAAVVVWYSAAGGVFASNCHNGILPETATLTELYANASGYPSYQSFDFYTITGDMVNWLAKEGIPGISVLLTNHEDIEWNNNKAGIQALLNYYAQ